MTRPVLGLLLGLFAGAIDVGLMVPLKFADRTQAMTAAFFSRFAIGFLAANITLPLPWWATGALTGLLISVPDAIVTKAYVPILVTGIVFGVLAAGAATRWGH